MTQSSEDTGVILALMDRFNKQRLPRVLELKKRVEQGHCLSETDIDFLEKIFKDANQTLPQIERHPHLQPIASRALNLYNEITSKALENEKQTQNLVKPGLECKKRTRVGFSLITAPSSGDGRIRSKICRNRMAAEVCGFNRSMQIIAVRVFAPENYSRISTV